MEIFDILQREWPLIAGAPVIAVGGGLVLLAAAFTAAWRLKSAIDDGQIKQRDAEISVFNARLLFAKNREQAVQMAREEVEKQVQELKAQIAAGSSKEMLAPITARVDKAIFDFRSANNELQKAFATTETAAGREFIVVRDLEGRIVHVSPSPGASSRDRLVDRI